MVPRVSTSVWVGERRRIEKGAIPPDQVTWKLEHSMAAVAPVGVLIVIELVCARAPATRREATAANFIMDEY